MKPQPEQIRVACEYACKVFQYYLESSEGLAARNYLAERGVHPEWCRYFRIGYAPAVDQFTDKIVDAYGEDIARQTGLYETTGELKCNYYDRVMFPVCDPLGRVVGFVGRVLDDSKIKYLIAHDTLLWSKSRCLYNIHLAKKAILDNDYAIVVEGQMDCVGVFQAGFYNVVSTSGCYLTEEHIRLLLRYTNNFVLNYDPDKAGDKASARAVEMVKKLGGQHRIITLPQGFDPDRFIRVYGRQAYFARLLNAGQ
jgi:DNA primase